MVLTLEEKKERKRISDKKYREKNKEKIKLSKNRWYKNNEEKYKETHKKWQMENKDKVKEYKQKYKKDNPEKIHQASAIHNWKKSGLIHDDYDKLYKYYMSINNCQVCNKLFDKETRLNYRCLDHDHDTGKFRCVACWYCNINNKMIIPH